MEIILTTTFTRNAETDIANKARLHGVDEFFMITMARHAEATKDTPSEEMEFAQQSVLRTMSAFTTLPPVCSVMFNHIVEVRDGDSFVTSATMPEALAQELGLENGSLVDILIETDDYTPEKGIAVKAAKLADDSDKDWILSAEFS